jgi:hypothetical protein
LTRVGPWVKVEVGGTPGRKTLKNTRRVCVLVLLLVLLIPTTVFPSSGDGDIPERRTSGYTESQGPFQIPESDLSWNLIWSWIVEALSLLP